MAAPRESCNAPRHNSRRQSPIREEAFMNLKHALAAAFLSTFALGAVAQGTTPPTDGPPKGAASGNKVADKGDGKNVADKDDPKKDGKKGHRKHHDHKKEG